MRNFSYLSLCFLLLLFSACGNEASTANEATTAEAEETEAAAPKLEVTEMPTAVSFPDASINDYKYQDGQFTFDVSGYEFAIQTPDADQLMCANSDKGQHIHLIIDNEPYKAKYTAEFAEDIPDGEHYLLSFLSRSYHLSIKNPAAGAYHKVTTEGGSITSQSEIEGPMLFYSRPKGTYRGKKATENIMLDFYPVNAPAGEYQVKAEINGESFTFTNFAPKYIKGLPMGENTVTLTLLDKEGAVVDAPLNPVSRTFTLEELPTGE